MMKVATLFVFTQKTDYIPKRFERALILHHPTKQQFHFLLKINLQFPIQFAYKFAYVCVEDTLIAPASDARFATLRVTKR
jgi:hypothetical protein